MKRDSLKALAAFLFSEMIILVMSAALPFVIISQLSYWTKFYAVCLGYHLLVAYWQLKDWKKNEGLPFPEEF